MIWLHLLHLASFVDCSAVVYRPTWDAQSQHALKKVVGVLVALVVINLSKSFLFKCLNNIVWHHICNNEVYINSLSTFFYPFLNFNGCTVEVWQWISNFTPHPIIDVYRIMYVLMWQTVYELTVVLFWCLFQELRSNEGNKHQNNTRMSA